MIRLILLASCSACLTAACLPLATDRILASDLARANPAFASVEGTREIGPAPLAGVRRVLAAEEVVRIAKRMGVGIEEPAADICFERAAESLSAARLQPALAQALGMKNARIEVVDFSRYLIAPGTLEFARTGLSPTGFWRGRVVFAPGRSTPVWARVAIFDQATGDPITFATTRIASASLGPKEIERGDTVRVEVHSGGVLLAFDGAAETAGRMGDTVLIKNPDNGRRFQATVAQKGKVTIRK
jgi:hypothetical protein